MSLKNQKLACVQAFLEDRASERLMTRLLADAGENYAWFRRLAQHMFRSHLSPDEQRELLETAKEAYSELLSKKEYASVAAALEILAKQKLEREETNIVYN